jgi:hypothetical protein
MSGRGVLGVVYGALQRLYPRAFRDEYGEDMRLLVRDQLRDEPTWRVCCRTMVDLAVTVPTRHVEQHMPRTLTPVLVALASIAAAAATFAFVEGLAGVAVALVGAMLAVVIWRRERPARAQRRAAAHWWRTLGGGLMLLALVIGTTTLVGELSEPVWAVAAIALLLSVTLVGTGIVLGLVRLSDRHRSSRVAA